MLHSAWGKYFYLLGVRLLFVIALFRYANNEYMYILWAFMLEEMLALIVRVKIKRIGLSCTIRDDIAYLLQAKLKT